MMHKAWSSIEEVPYCIARSSVKFHGHTGGKNWRFESNLRLLGRSQLSNPSDLPCLKMKACFLTPTWLAVMFIDLKLVKMIATNSDKLYTDVQWNISHWQHHIRQCLSASCKLWKTISISLIFIYEVKYFHIFFRCIKKFFNTNIIQKLLENDTFA